MKNKYLKILSISALGLMLGGCSLNTSKPNALAYSLNQNTKRATSIIKNMDEINSKEIIISEIAPITVYTSDNNLSVSRVSFNYLKPRIIKPLTTIKNNKKYALSLNEPKKLEQKNYISLTTFLDNQPELVTDDLENSTTDAENIITDVIEESTTNEKSLTENNNENNLTENASDNTVTEKNNNENETSNKEENIENNSNVEIDTNNEETNNENLVKDENQNNEDNSNVKKNKRKLSRKNLDRQLNLIEETYNICSAILESQYELEELKSSILNSGAKIKLICEKVNDGTITLSKEEIDNIYDKIDELNSCVNSCNNKYGELKSKVNAISNFKKNYFSYTRELNDMYKKILQSIDSRIDCYNDLNTVMQEIINIIGDENEIKELEQDTNLIKNDIDKENNNVENIDNKENNDKFGWNNRKQIIDSYKSNTITSNIDTFENKIPFGNKNKLNNNKMKAYKSTRAYLGKLKGAKLGV